LTERADRDRTSYSLFQNYKTQLISKLQNTFRRFIFSFALLREIDLRQRRKDVKEDEL
jgi:hypothetical protein